MKKRRKIYYVPGLLSLIFLPILCYLYLFPFTQKDERVLEITFCGKYIPGRTDEFRFDTTVLSQPRNRRNYDTFLLNGNRDNIKLDSFRILVRKMVGEKDTINGVYLELLDGSKYGSFVKTINIFKQESLHSYAAFENQVWGLYTPITPERLDRIKKRKIEEDSLNKAELMERSLDKETFADRAKSSIAVWPIFIGIIILSLISIYKVLRK